jgi:hypothetical protein
MHSLFTRDLSHSKTSVAHMHGRTIERRQFLGGNGYGNLRGKQCGASAISQKRSS